MRHQITLLLELDDKNCSLIRMISSYIMNTSNFTIDEMDEFKFLLHDFLTHLKMSIPFFKPIQITFISVDDIIEATIMVDTQAEEHNYSINQKNTLYQIAKHLLKDITFDDSQQNKIVFTLKKEKRAIHG